MQLVLAPLTKMYVKTPSRHSEASVTPTGELILARKSATHQHRQNGRQDVINH